MDASTGVAVQLKKMTSGCPANVSKNSIKACTDRISGFYSQFNRKRYDQFSALMSDEEYLATQPKEVMKLPPELESASRGLP